MSSSTISLPQLPWSAIQPTRPSAPYPVYRLPQLPSGMKHRFHAMVKPVGSACNLDCTYCYYLHKEKLLGHEGSPRMADELLEEHMDPLERANLESTSYIDWVGPRMFMLAPAAGYVAQWMQSFREFPPRMKPGSFSLDRVMESVNKPHTGSN